MLVAYVHARREPPDDSAGRDPGRESDDPLGIVLAVWLWAIMLVMIAGAFVSWL